MRNRWFGAVAFGLVVLVGAGGAEVAAAGPSWLEGARISSPYDDPAGWSSWEEGVQTAVDNGATVILDWGMISDNWKPLFEPDQTEAVTQIGNRAAWVHQQFPGVHYIVYVAPLEYVTEDLDSDGDGVIDPGKEGDSLSLQHPEWAQVGIDGRSAFFFGFQPGMPFWVCSTCEDVWTTPANDSFRQAVLGLYRRLASTELDGLWLDVPFLMDEFGENWNQQFPDVGPSARALFEAQTGLTLGTPPLAPDWSDPTWQAFIGWRYRLIEDFLGEVDQETRGVDGDFALIVESSVSWNNRMTGFGAGPATIPGVVQTTAHELGGTERPTSVFGWQFFLAQLQAWRHVDLQHDEASWLLGYVEAGHSDTFAVGLLHAAAAGLSGFGLHVSGAENMTTMHDRDHLRRLNAWLGGIGGDLWRGSVEPMANTAVVFSRPTMDFVSRASWDLDDYGAAFLAVLMMLQEHHIPYEVISVDDLNRLEDFETAIVPDGRCLGDDHASEIRQWVASGGKLLATGRTSSLDEKGNARADYALTDVFGVHLADVQEEDERVFENAFGQGLSVLAPMPHELYYFWAADPENPQPADGAEAANQSAAFDALYQRLAPTPLLEIEVSAEVVVLPWRTANGKFLLSVVNFSGIDASTAKPRPVTFDLRMHLPPVASLPAVRSTEILDSSRSIAAVMENDTTLDIHLEVQTGSLVEILPTRQSDPVGIERPAVTYPD
jgi:hypothetical protein